MKRLIVFLLLLLIPNCAYAADTLKADELIANDGITLNTDRRTAWPDLTSAILHADITEAEGFLRKTGAATYEAVKSNIGAAVDPTINEDSGDGYAVGSTWINTTADKEFICLDATVGAAVWVERTAGAAGGIGSLLEDTTPQLGGMLDVNGFALGDGTLELLKFIETGSAVNEITITNSATGNGPSITSTGGDVNINLVITPKGTGSLVLDGLNWPTADGALDQVLKTDGAGNLSWTSSAGVPVVDTTSIAEGSADATKEVRFEVDGLTTATVRVITMADQNIDLTPGAGSYATEAEGNLAATALQNLIEDVTPQLGAMLDVNGFAFGDGTLELLKFVETGSAVNEITVTNATTGNGPSITATGDDADIDLVLDGKGVGVVGTLSSNLDITGNIIVSGTVDGRDVAADGTKLDGIESGATADQSNAEIKTAYEANANTNEFSDSEQTKLAGIETAADVTDATNVAAAGAIMHSGIAELEGMLRKTGSSTYEAIKTNLNATVDPTVNEDSGDGYAIGSVWINTTADKIFQAADVTVAAAVWKDIGAGSGGGGLNNIIEDTTPQLGGQLDVNGNALGDGTLELLKFSETVSAVNEITIANSATGNGPSITATGDDANIDIVIDGKGTGAVSILSSNLDITGNIIISGTVDGRDVGTDGTKLDGIESGATADQSNAEIKTAYEANANTNEFSDAEQTKLAGVESGADVTDAANVAASGAVMDSDITAAEGFMRKTGAGAYEAIKTNIGATVDPTVNEDSGDGYAVGSIWINTTADKTFILQDATVAAAVWTEITAGAAGGIGNLVEDVTPQLGGDLDVNGSSIVSVSNGDIAITPNGTGDVVLDGINWPQADGTASQTLVTNGAGQLSWASLYGRQTIYVPASALTARTTNGPAIGSAESTTNKIMMETHDYDSASDEFSQMFFQAPKSSDEGSLYFQFIWQAAATTGNVVWGVQCVAFANDDPIDAAFGTAVTVTDGAGSANNDVMHSAETAAVTCAGTPGEAEWYVIQIYRDADNASDTLAVDAKLLGARIQYTNNALRDN